METFEDLVFVEHPNCGGGTGYFSGAKQAVMHFKNGYGVSVIFGKMFYSNGVDNYEVAVLCGDDICYDTEIANDVIGYISKEEVTEVMRKVQSL